MPADLNRVKEIFLEAAGQPDEATRAAYLDRACGGDAELRERVEALLRSHDPAGSFLGTPAAGALDSGQAGTMAFDSSDPGDGPANPDPDDEGDGLPFLTPSTRPDSLGRLGHYEMLQVLGKGGFGIVFRAFDETLQRVVAVKVLAPQIATLSPARKRFLREARSSAQVRHENVVQVYEVGEHPLPYLAMEFIPGETLQQKLDRSGPLQVSEVLRIGRQIAEGLAAAHACDLIHRDIKPANVLLEGGSQKAKITDFGLARAADDASISQSGIIAGTPMFMAPEQALGHKIDQRADLFSLGSVLYQMASGRPPFRAPSALAVLKRVAEEPPRPIPEIIPETPDWLCGVIAKLHAKNPDDRFQSARETADVLADCEAQLKAHAKIKDFSRIPQGIPAARAGGRWKWAAAAALLLSVLGLALTEITGATHLLRDWELTHDPRQGVRPEDNGPETHNQQPTAASLKYGDLEYTNTLGMKFKLIPAGKFTMGSSQEEIDRCVKIGLDQWAKDCIQAEGPEHPVEITQPFYMGATDVTVGQFRQFVEEEGYQVGDARWRNPGFDQTDKHPVVWITWTNAVDFCKWLSAKEGKEYRLPTEAEWEYSCRAGKTGSRYCFGDDEAQLENYAWYNTNAGGGTHPVGKKKPNDWGLYDMHGNVWELCQDNYDPDYYKTCPVKDPPGPGAGGVWRGGSWRDPPGRCRSACRNHAAPGHRDHICGFRVALSVSPPAGGRTESEAKDKPSPPAIAPFTDADVQRIAALPAEQQVEEVRKELIKRNPDFDGMLTSMIANDAVIGLTFRTDHVVDISPVRALTRLQIFRVQSWPSTNGLLTDLSPLQGMSLVNLEIGGTKVADLSPLKGMKLRRLIAPAIPASALTPLQGMPITDLGLHGTSGVTDLKPLQGMPLENLNLSYLPMSDLSALKGMISLRLLQLAGTQLSDLTALQGLKLIELGLNETSVTDLSPLKGMPLRKLSIYRTGIPDLTPLQGMPLEEILLTPKNITKGLDILREMESLKTIGVEWNQSWPAAEFWQRYDKGEFKE